MEALIRKQILVSTLSVMEGYSPEWIWVCLLALVVGAGLYSWLRLSQERTVAAPAEQPTPSPRPKFRPFELQADLTVLAGSAVKSCLRLRFGGEIKLDRSLDLVLLVGVRDVTDDVPRPVFGIMPDQRDPDTGEFRMKHKLGSLLAPGRVYDGWNSLGQIDLASLQGPFAGNRQLQVFCAGVSAPLAEVLDPTQNLYHECWASVTVEAYLSKPGYSQLKQARCVGAGLVVGASLAVARAEGWSMYDAVSRVRTWMSWHRQAQRGRFPEEAEELRRSLEGALELALRIASPREAMVAKLVALRQPLLDQELFRLCLAMGRRQGGMATASMVELARQLDVPSETWVRLHAESQEHDDLEAAALEFGLEPSWEPARIRAYLRKEFATCNARSLLADTGTEREELQARMAIIAKLARRYG